MEASTLRRHWRIAGLALVALLTLSGSLPGRAGEAGGPDSVAGDVDPASLGGGAPDRCVFAAPDLELCRWEFQGRLFAAGTDAPRPPVRLIHLICELPLGAQESAEPRCRIHTRVPSPLPPVAASGPQERPLRGLQALHPARTLAELSHALGDIPERCQTGAGQQTCVWLLRPGSNGHRHLEGSEGEPLLLRCALPLDGSPRSSGSCSTARLAG